METMDIIIGVLVAVGIVLGLMKGLVKQLASIVGLVVGLLVARALFIAVGDQLAPALDTSVTVARVLAFVLIWVVVPLGFVLVASLFTKALNVLHLGWLNRLLGGVLGALKYLLFIGLAIYILEYIDPKGEFLSEKMRQESVLYGSVKKVSGIFFPLLKNVTEQLKEI